LSSLGLGPTLAFIHKLREEDSSSGFLFGFGALFLRKSRQGAVSWGAVKDLQDVPDRGAPEPRRDPTLEWIRTAVGFVPSVGQFKDLYEAALGVPMFGDPISKEEQRALWEGPEPRAQYCTRSGSSAHRRKTSAASGLSTCSISTSGDRIASYRRSSSKPIDAASLRVCA